MNVIVKAYLRDTRTNSLAVYESEYTHIDEGDYTGIIHHWTDGNYGCDCNRSMFHGVDDLDCNYGENVIALDLLTANGLAIYDAQGEVVPMGLSPWEREHWQWGVA